MFMPMTKLYLKVLVVKMLPHLTESGADVGISNRGDVHTLITFESWAWMASVTGASFSGAWVIIF